MCSMCHAWHLTTCIYIPEPLHATCAYMYLVLTRCARLISLLADEACLFVEDHNPDPTLHSHLEHTTDKTETVASGNISEEDEESESGGTPHTLDGVVRDEEVGAEGKGMEIEEEDSSHKLKGNMKGSVKRKGVRTVKEMIEARPGEVDEEGEVSRCRVGRRRLVCRTRRVSMWQRVKLRARKSQHIPQN